jgi:hypothetical protein
MSRQTSYFLFLALALWALTLWRVYEVRFASGDDFSDFRSIWTAGYELLAVLPTQVVNAADRRPASE